jgi:hypothetical protein
MRLRQHTFPFLGGNSVVSNRNWGACTAGPKTDRFESGYCELECHVSANRVAKLFRRSCLVRPSPASWGDLDGFQGLLGVGALSRTPEPDFSPARAPRMHVRARTRVGAPAVAGGPPKTKRPPTRGRRPGQTPLLKVVTRPPEVVG